MRMRPEPRPYQKPMRPRCPQCGRLTDRESPVQQADWLMREARRYEHALELGGQGVLLQFGPPDNRVSMAVDDRLADAVKGFLRSELARLRAELAALAPKIANPACETCFRSGPVEGPEYDRW